MLNPEPAKRATLKEIQAHPWLNKRAPVISPRIKHKSLGLDQEILTKLESLGFSSEEVVDDMHSNQTVKGAYIMYEMLVEKKSGKSEVTTPPKQRSTPETEPAKKGRLKMLMEKIGRWKSSPEITTKERRRTIDLGSAITTQFMDEENLKQLRVSKAPYTSETTSVKHLDLIREEIEVALRKSSIKFTTNKKITIYYCEDVNELTYFEIEIVRVAKLEGCKAVDFKKKRGDEFEFNMLKQRILNNMHL